MVPRSSRMNTVQRMDMENSTFRIMLVAQFNLIIRVLEILYHQTTLAEMEHGWPLLYSFFVLRMVPLFLGCILIYSVYQDNRDGCMMWCAGEIGVVFGYLALVFLSTPLNTWEDNDILVFTYCMLRFASIMLVFDYIEQLDIFLDQEEREKEAGLRNHFWYQLALLHAENALAKEKAVEQENARETPLSEDSQKDKDI